MQAIKEIRGDDNLLLIYWQITNYCNFSCSYCPPFLHSGSDVNLQPPIEVIRPFCERVNEIAENGKKIDIDLAGGEPTTHKHIQEIVSFFSNRVYVGITTNGSRPTNWWKNFSRLPNRVIISIHDESNIPRINETADFLISRDVNVHFNCSMDANNWERSVSRYEELSRKYGWRASHKVINTLVNGWQDVPQTLTDEQKNYLVSFDKNKIPDPFPDHTARTLKERQEKAGGVGSIVMEDGQEQRMSIHEIRSWVVRRHLNRFTGWICNAGISSVLITPRGNVMGGLCKSSLIGHISDFRIAEHPILCNRRACPCPADVSVSKRRI